MNILSEANSATPKNKVFFNPERETNPDKIDRLEIAGVFNAMANGNPVSEVNSRKGDGSRIDPRTGNNYVEKIKQLAERAQYKDERAISEINTIRTFAVMPALTEEFRIMELLGRYHELGYGESARVQVWDVVGDLSREQANAGDVVLSRPVADFYYVDMTTISSGYAIDYRKMAMGDLWMERTGMEQIRIDMRNLFMRLVIDTIQSSIKNAKGVKYYAENAGLTKTMTDDILTKVRRLGKPTLFGDYAVISQINNFIGYGSGIAPNVAISQDALNQILKTNLVQSYGGAPVVEMPNGYNFRQLNGNGDNFKTVLPTNLLFVIPNTYNSAMNYISTFARGGLTTQEGNNVATGNWEVRFDLEVGADLARGHEFGVGLLNDTDIETSQN